MVTLVASSVRYGSRNDEAAFFEWLDKMPCVKRYWGRGTELYIEVLETRLTQDAVRDLLALFDRYDVETGQLAALERPKFSEWFRDPGKYWHKAVFGSKSTPKKRKPAQKNTIVTSTKRHAR